MTYRLTVLMIALALPAWWPAPLSAAQEAPAEAAAPEPAAEPGPPAFAEVAAGVESQLGASLAELSALRQRIADETIPLSRELSALETELLDTRRELQAVTRELDSRTLEMSNLRQEIKARTDEAAYLSNLLGEYLRNLETRLHVAELKRYAPLLDAAKLAVENEGLSRQEVFAAQEAMVSASLARLESAMGGVRFRGEAVNGEGMVKPGTFLLVGPAALFASEDGQDVGTAQQRLGSTEPAVTPFASPETTAAAAELVRSGEGRLPFDPTLGSAHVIEQTRETLVEHVQKGGPVMIPIFVLAGAALLVALYKWVALTLTPKPGQRKIQGLLDAVSRGDEAEAKRRAGALRGPIGAMLAAGTGHLGEPRDLIEEVMYEKVLEARLKLERFLPFIAITAASAPLLGLLGTVTGIINTFKLITVFGTGDVKTLSSGISEALITTEFGLIVAIPSLLLHSFLSRRSRGLIDRMEKAAFAFMNHLSRSRDGAGGEAGDGGGHNAPPAQPAPGPRVMARAGGMVAVAPATAPGGGSSATAVQDAPEASPGDRDGNGDTGEGGGPRREGGSA